jgi:uncharacterized membrane protein
LPLKSKTMEQNYPHLLLNHLPIILTIIGSLVLLYSLLRKNSEVTKVALIILIFSALITIPAFLTGEGSEHAIEHFPEVSHDQIEEHEEDGLIALYFNEVTGILALISLVLLSKNNSKSKFLLYITLIFSLFTTFLLVHTGLEGGKIRRPELRNEISKDSIEHED